MNYIIIVVLTSIHFISFGQIKKGNEFINIDINGVWMDSSSTAIQNAVAVISEQNGTVVVAHYLEWNGNKFVEHGIGKRNGNTISYTAKVTLPIKDWATEGTHNFNLSSDGQTLRGTYKDNLGNEGPIVFKRVR